MTATPAAGPGGAPRPPGRGIVEQLDRLPLLATALVVALAGAVIRLCYFPVPALDGADCDGAAYLELARQIGAGRGFVTDALYHLWNRPASFPHPESLWNPLYPYAVAALDRGVGDLWLAGKLVSLLHGVLIPPLTLLAAERFTGRRAVAVLAGLLAAAEPTLVTWSVRSLTEIGTVMLVTLAWVLAFRPGRAGALATGAALGLAYLQKYQSGLLWVAIVPVFLHERGWRPGLRALAWSALGFALVAAPWWVRNLQVFGDPFYSSIKWNLLCDWAALGGDEHRYWTRLVRPPDLPSFALSHPRELLRQAVSGTSIILRVGWQDHVGSAWLVPLWLVGLLHLGPRRSRWAWFTLYLLVVFALSAISIPRPRFLLSALPALMALAAAGAVALLEGRLLPRSPGGPARASAGWRRALPVLGTALVALTLADFARAVVRQARDTTTSWNPRYYCCALEEKAAGPFLRARAPDRSPVIVAETSHGALYLERPALRLPFDEAGVDSLRHRFGARWLVLTDRERAVRLPSWEHSPPAWARPVWSARPEEYAPEAVAAGYRDASPVTVFELDPVPGAGPR